MSAIDVIHLLLFVFFLFVLFELGYTIRMALIARNYTVTMPEPSTAVQQMFYVFLVPCLNEERVVARTIERLLRIPGDRYAVLVIDDYSSDSTAAIAESYASDQVWVMRRTPPTAQNGKGQALNAALEWARDRLAGEVGEAEIVACVVDADGEIDPGALSVADPMFAEFDYAGLQMLVRMSNREDTLLARMQDFEFVVNGGIYQRARQYLGCPALGGNAQFTSLASLDRLDGVPWSECLVEDLELSIRMQLQGDRIGYSDGSLVEQQGLVNFRKLIRQRSRWFQGKMQCWKWIRPVRRSKHLNKTQKFDMVHDLMGTLFIIQSSLMSLLFFVLLFTWASVDLSNLISFWTSWYCLPLIILYLLAFGMTPVYAHVYKRTDGVVSYLKALAYAHLYVIYEFHWAPAGWIGTYRHLRGRAGWLKTERV